MFDPAACESGPDGRDPARGIAYWRSVGVAKSVATGGSVMSPFYQGISRDYQLYVLRHTSSRKFSESHFSQCHCVVSPSYFRPDLLLQ